MPVRARRAKMFLLPFGVSLTPMGFDPAIRPRRVNPEANAMRGNGGIGVVALHAPSASTEGWPSHD